MHRLIEKVIFDQYRQVKYLQMILGRRIRELRERQDMLLREVAAILEIDTALLSKIERDEKPCKKEHVIKLQEVFEVGNDELLVLWLADKISKTIEDEAYQKQALNMVIKNIDKNEE